MRSFGIEMEKNWEMRKFQKVDGFGKRIIE